MLFDPKWGLDQASLALLCAADVLEKNGWCQGNFEAYDGSRCVLGAIYHATERDEPLRVEVIGRLRAFVKATSNLHIAMWNDRPDRTVEQVTAALRQIAQEGKNDRG